MMLYYSLYLAAFLCLAWMVATSVLPWTAALPAILVPTTLKILSQARLAAKGSREAMLMLESTAAKFHFQFGLLLISGVVIQPFTQGWLL
jgi:1,4-dihydroxy-2-naphthoate octaprenyltransferase